MSNEEQKRETDRQSKEIIREEQFWFTATTLGFTGFVGALLKTPTQTDLIISISLISILSLFSIFLIVGRHKKYRELNGEIVSNWWIALGRAVKELSGTLYCVAVISFSAIGFILILLTRFSSKFCF
jgi:ABC-type uncharacterized transport system YnjBCD permease subunit